MTRPAEFAYQQGTEAEFELFVRAEYPQCIRRDQDGNELVPVQYQSAYSHVVGLHYVPALTLVSGQAPQNQALMFDEHVEPARTEQSDRITARVLFVETLIDTPPTPPNQEFRDAVKDALDALETTPYAGVILTTVGTLGWAGNSRRRGQGQERALERVSERVPAVSRAVEAIQRRNGKGKGNGPQQ